MKHDNLLAYHYSKSHLEHYSGTFVSVALPFCARLTSPEQASRFLYWMAIAHQSGDIYADIGTSGLLYYFYGI